MKASKQQMTKELRRLTSIAGAYRHITMMLFQTASKNRQ